MRNRGWAALAAAWWCISSAQASAAAGCDEVLSRDNVVRCVLAASAQARAEREGIAAVEGRQRVAGTLLPANPVLAASGARRVGPAAEATNWYGTLSQELEIAGQRRARKRALAGERRAQESATLAVERDVSAAALRSYFEVLAAREALGTAQRLEQTFAGATTAAEAAAERGLNPGIDADLAELSSVRLTQARLDAERRFHTALAALATMLGRDPALSELRVDGELTPLSPVDGGAAALSRQAIAKRPEIPAVDAARASFEAWSEAYRRARIPNLTLSVIAQRDGFDERVLGAGVSIPITLPAPIGRDFSGQVAENAALARRAAALLEQAQRDVRLEVVDAWQALQAARSAQALFSEERIARAERSLKSIALAIATGKLAISAVIVPQQALIEFLNQRIAAELALCLASVELVRAAGLPFPGGAR